MGCKWVFKVKENPDGTVNNYKAHFLAKGFHQQLGFDYNKMFSPIVKPTTTKIIITLTLTHNWEFQQIDINNAFLNGTLEEEVFMLQPSRFPNPNKS